MGNSSSKPSSGSSSKSSKLNKSSNKKAGSSNISSSSSAASSSGKKTGLLNKRKGNVQSATGSLPNAAGQTAQTSVNTTSLHDREAPKHSTQAGTLNNDSPNRELHQAPNKEINKQQSTTEQRQRQNVKSDSVNNTIDKAANAVQNRSGNTTEPSKSYQRHKRSKSTGSIPSSEISAEVAKHKEKTTTASAASRANVEKMKNVADINIPSDQEIGEEEEEEEEDEEDEDEDEEDEAGKGVVKRSSQEKIANRTSSSSSKKSGSIFNKRPSSSSATLSPPPLSKASSFSKSAKSSRKSSFDQTLPPSMVTIKPSTSILKKNPSRHSMSSSAYYSDNALTDDETDPSNYHGGSRRSFDSSRRQFSSSSRRSSSTSVVSGTTGNLMNNGAGGNVTNSPYTSTKDRNSSFGDNNDFQNLADPLSRTSTRNSGNSVSNNTINSTGSGNRNISSSGNGGNMMGSRKSSFSSLKSTGKTAYSTPAGSPGIEMYQSAKAGEGDYFSMNDHASSNEGGNAIPGAYSQLSGQPNGEQQQIPDGEPLRHHKYAHSHVEPDLSQLDPEERELFLAQMQRVNGSENNASIDNLEGSSQTHHRHSKQYGAEELARPGNLGPSGSEKKPIKRPLKPLNVDITIQKLLDAGYSGKRTKNLVLKNSEIQQICSIARDIFLEQPPLLELSPPVKIVGDVHGQFQDLIRMFDKCGFPPSANYLFLGDYVDRGKQSLETILLLLCFKIKYPENFFLLRGNHECASVTRVYGFYDECKRRCNIKTWKLFVDTFNTLPLAAIVAGKIFCVHGGLSPVLNSMDEIRHVSRPTDVPDFGLINDLLWSDPTDSINEWEDNERGVSYCYNKVAINKFLNRFGFDLVCRAHMVVEDGYEFFNAHTLVTVFSAPNYCGEFDNWGAVMSVSDALLCSFELLEPLDSAALKQVMKKGRQERKQAALQAAEFEQQELQELQQQQQSEDRMMGDYSTQDVLREKTESGQPEPAQA